MPVDELVEQTGNEENWGSAVLMKNQQAKGLRLFRNTELDKSWQKVFQICLQIIEDYIMQVLDN